MYESITPEELKNLLIKKHKEFFEKYERDYVKIKTSKEKEMHIKKRIEILPDKREIFKYWASKLEEEIYNAKSKAEEEAIYMKIQEYRNQMKKAEEEFTISLEELKNLEESEVSESKENWLLNRAESHKKALSFWENFDTNKMQLE